MKDGAMIWKEGKEWTARLGMMKGQRERNHDQDRKHKHKLIGERGQRKNRSGENDKHKGECNTTYLDDLRRHGLVGLILDLHIPFQVDIEELEDEVEFLVCVHDVHQPKGRV
jgi:hypothetical protein